VKIAFLHYHLKPGGVATVLRHQIRALQHEAQLLVISGEPPPPDFPCEVACVAGLGYTAANQSAMKADQIAEEVRRTIYRQFGGPCDLLHIHNPLLAKNSLFLDIIQDLQQAGLTLFLQIHDLAEDGRPGACFAEVPYPVDCHYGAINSRDWNNLAQAGLAPEGLHFLPNCVVPFERASPAGEETHVLYPVRAIRRKNIGEALLISRYLPGGQSLFFTQPPNSPADFGSYNDWKRLAAAYRLPVRFEMGTQRAFQTLVASAAWVLTTSIAEGFGFAFLEPWTAGKALKGRLLPDICRDFSAHGIDLKHLYPGIRLPMEWIGRQRIVDRFKKCLEFNRRAYGSFWPAKWTATCLQTLGQNDGIDFGLLDEGFQKECIDRVHQNPIDRQELLAMNPGLKTLLADTLPREHVSRNCKLIVSHYHPDRYREQLIDIYTRVLEKPVKHSIDRRKLLASYLKPDNFSLLKWGPYRG